jgi:hypothetical protein
MLLPQRFLSYPVSRCPSMSRPPSFEWFSEFEENPPSFLNLVMGIATFDLNNFPIRYYAIDETIQVDWIQAAFQALCLQAFLSSSLTVGGFKYVIIRGKDPGMDPDILIIRQSKRYVGLLVRSPRPSALTNLILDWAQTFDPSK